MGHPHLRRRLGKSRAAAPPPCLWTIFTITLITSLLGSYFREQLTGGPLQGLSQVSPLLQGLCHQCVLMRSHRGEELDGTNTCIQCQCLIIQHPQLLGVEDTEKRFQSEKTRIASKQLLWTAPPPPHMQMFCSIGMTVLAGRATPTSISPWRTAPTSCWGRW